jgi:hypothetical protein
LGRGDGDAGVKGAGLIAGAAMRRENHVEGSGRKVIPRPERGRLSSPISHAEIGET